MRKTELLSPAGTLKNLRYALAYGADAVYAGQPRYSLRVRNNDFDLENLKTGIAEAHAMGRKVYVVVNIQPHNAKLRTFRDDMREVMSLGPDALIMSDPGLMMLLKEDWPEACIHLSVQANAVNWATVKFYERFGVSRVILSRELSIDEIEEIRQRCPDIELEVFVHGALCMAYSGRCLLSGYLNHRDPNQGTCTNACRWKYSIKPAVEDDLGNIVALGHTTQPALLAEETRPDELMSAFEDEHGTYIFNSRDLKAVRLVEQLVKIGVDSLKIEGRTKSFYYVARTAQIYRRAIDDALAGRPYNPALSRELDTLAARGTTEGFLVRKNHSEYQNYQQGTSVCSSAVLAGEITGADGTMAYVDVRNRFQEGDDIRIITPNGDFDAKVANMLDQKKNPVAVAPGDGHKVCLPLGMSADQLKHGIVLKLLGRP
ncbi:MAG: tRNA 5-hydroxyuridine modification protein YegQ [Succinivibrionaceae bacterium]|nr:tRNA 5-hydroxyuridine modification protein YegQ [Succinivibrionaceae bacterium]